MGKRPDGSLPPWAYVVWWPYLLGLSLKLHLKISQPREEPLMDEVQGGLWVSGWPRSAAVLPAGKAGVAVIDVTCELPRRHAVGPYLNLPAWDTDCASVSDIQRGVEFALEAMAAGHAVVVHCAHGHGRSAQVAAAVLLAKGLALSPRDAEKYMQRTRPRVRLNARQHSGLGEWVAWSVRARGGVAARPQGGGWLEHGPPAASVTARGGSHA